MVGFTLWQLYNPYLGIRHDARVYVLGAVRWLTPDSYLRDLWFMFGSQEAFSVFSPLLGTLIRVVDIAPAAKVAAWAGGICWVTVAYLLCRTALGPQRWILAFTILVAAPLNYSPSLPIYLTEAFATSRPFAMSLTLIALVLALRGRLASALVLAGLATVLHPLMGIWGTAVIIALRVPDRMLAIGIAVAAVALLAASWNPMDWPNLVPISGDWAKIIQGSPMVVLRPWPDLAVDPVLWSLAILLWGGRYGRPELRRLYRVVALLGAVGLLAALYLGNFSPIRLFLQLQPWRALWLATVAGVVAALDVGDQLFRSGPKARAALALATATLVSRGSGGGLLLAMAFALIAWRPALVATIRDAASARKWLWLFALGIVLASLPGLLADLAVRGGATLQPGAEKSLSMLGYGLVIALVFALPPLFAAALMKHVRPVLLALIAVVSSGWAALHWDQRAADVRYAESRYHVGGNRETFGGAVQPGQVLYWPRQGLRVWFELGTANYASQEQGIGMIFSEGRALELRRRFDRVALAKGEPAGPEISRPIGALLEEVNRANDFATSGTSFVGHEPFEMADSGLRSLCADRAVDFVVDSFEVPGSWAAKQVDAFGSVRFTYFLYDCRRLRGDA